MKTLRILSYNILKGGVGREEPLAAVISSCKPDVVILQEAYRPAVVQQLAAHVRLRSLGIFARALGRVPEPASRLRDTSGGESDGRSGRISRSSRRPTFAFTAFI